MRLLSQFVEKAYCYPINHLSICDKGHLLFQARGDGLYPLIKDGDILCIQQVAPAHLQAGDMTVLERPTGEFAIDFTLERGRKTQKTSVCEEGNTGNGNEGLFEHEELVGWVTAIERDGYKKNCDNRFARFAHLIYVSAKPLMTILLILRKMLLLLHPRFFVRDPGSSLRGVVNKYNDAKEVLYYSKRASQGLDEPERRLLDQFMRCRGRVLSIGCGAGREAFGLAGAGFEVVGIDVSPPMIAEAKRHAQTSGIPVHFEVKGATELDYPANLFDYVFFSAAVYSHILTRQLRVNTLKRIKELLTPNGILIFSVEYRGSSRLSRVSLYDAFRRLAKHVLKKRLHAEPGDILVPHVSPVGTPSKLCYFHFFRDAAEVREELTSANFDGFEDEKSGYWIARALKEDNSKSTILREVAA